MNVPLFRHRVLVVLKRLGMACAVMAFGVALAACNKTEHWNNTELTGAMPDLAFEMTRADDGKQVTAADYEGKVALLYFGYTFCPDVCPTTLSNLALTLQKLGGDADKVRVLFVTVDPNRDTSAVLKQYVDAFGPEFDGLRGTDNALASLARRYRVSYSATPASGDKPYEVTHSSAIYVFDKTGKVRLLFSGLADANPDIEGAAVDLRQLINE